MASENEASCESDPNFAVICCFLEKFGGTCGLSNIDFLDLQEMLENTQEVSQDLIELHIKLLRKAKKSVSNERWERALIKMCHSYCSQDAWELERFGYKKSRISVKLRTLKHLLEIQFDLNQKFKNEVNKMSAEELRTQPLGRDRLGNAYWCQCDEACQIRVYKEDPDEETWTLVAKDRDGLVSLISQLGSGDSAKSSSEPVSNEDSNSVEVDKPILDTGQAQDSSNSSVPSAKQILEDDTEVNDKDLEIPNHISESKVENVTESSPQEKSKLDEEEKYQKENKTDSAEVKSNEAFDSEQMSENSQDKSIAVNKIPNEAIEEEEEEQESNELSEDSKSTDQSIINNNTPEIANKALNLSSKKSDSVNSVINYKKKSNVQFEYDSESKTGLDLSFKPKPTLRLKPLQELLGQSKLISHEPERKGFVGIKGKYIRGDPSGEKISLSFASHSSSALHRKAVQSASFDAISYKHSIEEDDYDEQPMKRSRFDRPSLLGNKKFISLYNQNEVEDEIEEPLMLVHGESSGYENKCNNSRKDTPVIGEEIEELPLYVFGEGNGADCQTGNENVSESDVPQSTNSNKTELKRNLNKDLPGSSDSILDSKCNLMSPSKSQYKLGTIIDTKTDKSITRTQVKKSRWDIVPDVNLNLNDSDAKVNENERVVEVSTSKVKELVGKFENLKDSSINTKANNKSIDNNNSDSSIPENQSDKSFMKKSVFFFGNSSNTLIGANAQSASLNFGTSYYSSCLKTPSLETLNISETQNLQVKNIMPVNTNTVPEKINETYSERVLQMFKCGDSHDSNTKCIDNEETTNCDSVLADTEVNECDNSVSSVNEEDADINSCKKTETDGFLVLLSDETESNDVQVKQSKDDVAAIKDMNLKSDVGLKNETVSNATIENSALQVFSNLQDDIVYKDELNDISSTAESKSVTIKGLTESKNPDCENEILADLPLHTLTEKDNIHLRTEATLSENNIINELSSSLKTSLPSETVRFNHDLLNTKVVNETDYREILDSNSNDVLEMKITLDSTIAKQDNTRAESKVCNIENISNLIEKTLTSLEKNKIVKLNENEKSDLEIDKQGKDSERAANSNVNQIPILSDDNSRNCIATKSTNCQQTESDDIGLDAQHDSTASQESSSDSYGTDIQNPFKKCEELNNTNAEKNNENISSTEDDVSHRNGEDSEDKNKIINTDLQDRNNIFSTTSEISESNDGVQDLLNSINSTEIIDNKVKYVLKESEEKVNNLLALETSVQSNAVHNLKGSATEQVDNEGVEDSKNVCVKLKIDASKHKQTQEKENSLEATNEQSNDERMDQNFLETSNDQVNPQNENILNTFIPDSILDMTKDALNEAQKPVQPKSNSSEQDIENEKKSLQINKYPIKGASNNCESSVSLAMTSMAVVAENQKQIDDALDIVSELNEGKEINESIEVNNFKKIIVESIVSQECHKVSSNSKQNSEVKQIDLELNSTAKYKTMEISSNKEIEENTKNTNDEAFENASNKAISENEEGRDTMENMNNANVEQNHKQITAYNEVDTDNTNSDNLMRKTDVSSKLNVNKVIVFASNPISLQENTPQDQEALPKAGRKRGRKPKLLTLEKRELRSKLKVERQSAEIEKEKTEASNSSTAQNKKPKAVKGANADGKLKTKVKRGRKPLNLKSKRIAVTVISKIKAKKLSSPQSSKKVSKKVGAKGQSPKEKVGRPRKSSMEKSVIDSSSGRERKLKPTTVSKVMKKTQKSPINMKLGRRRRKKDLIEKIEDVVVNKQRPKRKKIEITKKVETTNATRRRGSQLVVTLKRTELTKKLVADLKQRSSNIPQDSTNLNLTVSLERCEVPEGDNYLLHNKERMMSLRKRKPKPLGVVKLKNSKDVLKKKTETLHCTNAKLINNENIRTKEANIPEKTLRKTEAVKKDSALQNKIDNFDNSKSQKSCKSIASIPRRRSSRRKTIIDTETELNTESNQVQDMTKVETSIINECKISVMTGDKRENMNLNNVSINNEIKKLKNENSIFSVESEGLVNRFKLCNNAEDMNSKDDSLVIDALEGKTNKTIEAEDMETIDLTSESECVSNTTPSLYQEKLTDCKQGVMIKGVLIKGDVTIKVKERIPVEEPPCIKKNIPLLTCINIEKLKEPEAKGFPGFKVSSPPVSEESFGGDNNSDVVIIEDDPLADVAPVELVPAPLISSSFKLDSTEPLTTVTTRALRKRTRSELPEQIMEENGGKKRKMKGKRLLDLELRKSIEEQKRLESSSSEEDIAKQSKKKEPFFKSKNRKNMLVENPAYVNIDSPAAITLDSPTTIVVDSPTASSDTTAKRESPIIIKKRSPPKKRKKTLMGLDIPSPSAMDLQNDTECTVRQSRRIAQLKIREEAERRKLEEMTMNEVKVEKKYKSKKIEDKDYKAEKRKKNKNLIIEEDIAVDVPEVEEKKKKRKRKHKDPRKIFDESNPWRSSSDSSTSNEEDEEEEIVEYSEAESPLFKSDHEFSPESDLEESGDVQPLKRARTARKEDDVEEDLDDHACQKCSKQDHPEWILLCDKCDNGWHCSCLRPALLIIPEGDWFCPPCQHLTLIKNLEKKLTDYDKKLTKRDIEVRRKQRLAYVGITLANVLPVKDPSQQKRIKKARNEEDEESQSEESEFETESSSDSGSDEPIYQLRQRRQAHSYRFNDYDELINSAIQDEVEAKGIGNQGRGKDIATIVNAAKEEVAQIQLQELEPLPPVVPVEGKDLTRILLPQQQENDSNVEKIKPVNKLIGRKKPRKLNCLDVSSGDDPYSDEDFKGSSSVEEEDEYDDELGSESSEYYGRRDSGPVRRSTRARISRYDKEFINDDSDEDEIPRRKKIKSIWDDSESEESDLSWKSRRKRKGVSKRQHTVSKKKSSKKNKKYLSESDSDVYKKKKPKIKYGGLDDDEDMGRKTRGKRINYLDALASDSEEEVKKRGPPRIETDEEYDANEEQDLQEDDDEEDDIEEEKESDENAMVKGVEHPQISSLPNNTDTETIINNKIQEEITTIEVPETAQKLPLEKEKNDTEDHENEDEESDLNPIEEINKNLEQMNEKEMEMLMEEEEYANKQLQLMAMQLDREKKRKEREAKKLEKFDVHDTKVPKKRGRKPKTTELNNVLSVAILQVGPDMQANPELSEPPGVTIPIFNESSTATFESTPKKRRGRGKGKKTIEKEQAAAAAAAAATTTTTTYNANSSSSDHIPTTIDNIPSSSNSPSSNTSMHATQLTIASAPQPFSQSQPTPSVITRMLQSQPAQGSFHLAAGIGCQKYYSGEPQPSSHCDSSSTTGPPAQGQYMHSAPRVLASSYRQPLQNMNTYPIARGNPVPTHRSRAPGPQGIPPMYHSHHPLDPSPSGGGPINVSVGPMNMTTAPPSALSAATERNSPGVAPPTSDSPLSNKSDHTPPPPPYTRPQMPRFPQGSSSPLMSSSSTRHPHLITAQHVQQPRTSMPYHPGLPPNYYGSYIHPNMTTEESLPPPSYQYSEQFSERSSPQDNCKSYEEENSGEFGGLVSYFSSQREDDLDT